MSIWDSLTKTQRRLLVIAFIVYFGAGLIAPIFWAFQK